MEAEEAKCREKLCELSVYLGFRKPNNGNLKGILVVVVILRGYACAGGSAIALSRSLAWINLGEVAHSPVAPVLQYQEVN